MKNDPNFVDPTFDAYATTIDELEAKRLNLEISGSAKEKKTDIELSKPYNGRKLLRKVN